MAATPDQIGRYRVQEVIGAGAFATVYRATDERLEVDVAVKVLAENHSIDPDIRERFIEEGRRLRRVRSEGLLEVYDLGDTERAQPYLVLAWADRGDLARRVAERRASGWGPGADDVRRVAGTLAAALGSLHAEQLVHRDLTPRNLLIRSRPAGPDSDEGVGLLAADEELVLADLGMSKDLARASGLTVAAGTSGFAPPEQREPGGLVDHRADIWAASALVVWLVTGGLPDDEGRWREKAGTPGLPTALLPVLEQGLAVDPADRQPSMGRWREELEAAFVAAPEVGAVTAVTAVAEDPAAGAVWSGPRRGRLRSAVALVAGLLVGAGGAVGVAGLRSGDRAVEVEDLGDGLVRSSVSEHGVTAAVQGPDEVEVGSTVTLEADVEGVGDWAWVAPNGEFGTGRELHFDVVEPGRLAVRLLAAGESGRVVEVRHHMEVIGP